MMVIGIYDNCFMQLSFPLKAQSASISFYKRLFLLIIFFFWIAPNDEVYEIA
jgi:hypothetical protein